MKKVISIFLCITLLLGIFSVSVFAEKDNDFEDYEQRLYNAFINCEEEVDLTQYNVKLEKVYEFFNEILLCYPEISFNIAIVEEDQQRAYDFSCSYYVGSGNAAVAYIGYNMGKDEYTKAVEFIEDSVAPILNKVRNLSDFEKALYIHDWICVNFMYDYRLAESEGTENHDMLGFLKDKMGVCQSYAYTYMYMLRQVGVESHYVISDTDNHGWNVVKIDGNWYHVDVTHDDPIVGSTYHYDYMGEVMHSKFLLSDIEIIADGEHDDFYIPMDASISCGEYTGNSSWRTAVSSIVEIDGYWYYLDNSKDAGGLMKTRDFANVERIMKVGHYHNDLEVYGWAVGQVFYVGYYTGLCEYNEHLFFTDANNIYVYDTHHKIVNKLPIERPEEMHYFGLSMEGKTLSYLTSDSNIKQNVIVGSYTLVPGIHLLTDWEIIREATETIDGEMVRLCYFCGEVVERRSIPALSSSELLGDADGNGVTNASDLAVVKIYLATQNGEISQRADFNGDGVINTTDLASLKLKLAGVI